MRPRFEEDIKAFSKIAKDQLASQEDYSRELVDKLSETLDWHLRKAAERQGTHIEVQKVIYEIQKRRQEIMLRLKEQLICLDNPRCQVEKETNERFARFDEAKGCFRYKDNKGVQRTASFGELMTDMDWGVYCSLDKSVPRHFRKKYLVARAKKALQELLDKQILRSEIEGSIADPVRREIYKRIGRDRKSGAIKKEGGFVAELIVKNFLKKLSIDKHLPFEIYETDVFQDVEQKIDFIIHRKERLRGVNVETSEGAQDVGIQFSISQDPWKIQVKKHQIEKRKAKNQEDQPIQDIILVVFPLVMAKRLKKEWDQSGRQAGGPDRFMDRHLTERLFFTLLKGIFTSKEIESFWQGIENNLPSKLK